ncbi:hypothetical protein [Cognatishimia sp.]|uniref:hypothetical protein n=1 Tax=Cognatishimia sp. TaxID=2211648 RepID=UPI0035149D65|nr:hypothetical protein [Cognatishimia sp.]
MGGSGSGRHWQFGADTTDDYRSIDIRWLKREGLLESGVSRSITWSRGGEVTGSINVRSEPGRVILDYRQRDRGGEWQPERYPVYLDTTPCHMGGERHWFLCPARGCGRRVAILYGGAIFACRHCYRLAYPSQREKPGDRAARKADRIRDKLGWEGGVLNGPEPWNKPKGMHQATFDRLRWKHDRFADRALAGFAEQFGFDLPDEYRF